MLLIMKKSRGSLEACLDDKIKNEDKNCTDEKAYVKNITIVADTLLAWIYHTKSISCNVINTIFKTYGRPNGPRVDQEPFTAQFS
jgi:hypothetical protein